MKRQLDFVSVPWPNIGFLEVYEDSIAPDIHILYNNAIQIAQNSFIGCSFKILLWYSPFDGRRGIKDLFFILTH